MVMAVKTNLPQIAWLDCLCYLVREIGYLDNDARTWSQRQFYAGWHPASILHALTRGYWKNPEYYNLNSGGW